MGMVLISIKWVYPFNTCLRLRESSTMKSLTSQKYLHNMTVATDKNVHFDDGSKQSVSVAYSLYFATELVKILR